MEVKGTQFAAELVPRGQDDDHVCIQLKGKDDENGFEIGNPFSSFWLDDLIQVLQNAKAVLKSRCAEDPEGWGYKFKEES